MTALQDLVNVRENLMTSPELVKEIDNMELTPTQKKILKLIDNHLIGHYHAEENAMKAHYRVTVENMIGFVEKYFTIKSSILKKGYKGKLSDVVPYKGKDLKEGTELPKVSIHCPIHSKTVCVSIKEGIMCKRCFDKKEK